MRVTDEGILEAQRALAREEGLFVEPSSSAAMTAVMQLAARRALDPDATIVVVLTSSGLKDPARQSHVAARGARGRRGLRSSPRHAS